MSFTFFIDLSLQLSINYITSNQSTENYWSVTNLCELVATNSHSIRCRPYFGVTAEAVQCLTYQTEWNVRTCKKKDKTYSVLGCGVCGGRDFFTLSPSFKQSPRNREKSLCPTVWQLRWVISTWWDENRTLFVFSACYEIQWNWFCERK